MSHYCDLRKTDRERFQGMEIFEIKPIILGGSPTDPKNKTLLTREQHMEAVRYWNKIISDIKNKKYPDTASP